MTAEEAFCFVEEHGVVLVSAKGTAPSLVEAIAGHSIAHKIPFPEWAPPAVIEAADALSEQEALAMFGAWVTPTGSPVEGCADRPIAVAATVTPESR